jgi:GntR family transcriptional regulator, transcriptional repressor for pyruvate dehydrogenase complex
MIMLNPPTFPKLSRPRASDEIASAIHAQIAAGKLPVGTRLPSERVLAEQFGVSRNTLREAMRSIEHAGLISLKKGAIGGAIVHNRSGEAIGTSLVNMYHLGAISASDLTQARILYESIIIRLACKNATAQDIAALHANIKTAEQARLSGDFDRRIEAHIEFHRMLARMAGNSIMVVVMNGVLDIMVKFVRTLGPYDNSIVTPSRKRFMKHFEAGDSEAAVAEMQTLLTRLEKRYLSKVALPESIPADEPL